MIRKPTLRRQTHVAECIGNGANMQKKLVTGYLMDNWCVAGVVRARQPNAINEALWKNAQRGHRSRCDRTSARPQNAAGDVL